MTARFPDALHVVEGELPAAVAMRGGRQWIWSEHESLDESIAALHSALPEDERRARHTALAREARFVAAVQRRILRRADGVVYINERTSRRVATAAAKQFRTFLPLSIADEDTRWAQPAATPAEPLRVLHLGSVSHLPTYSSLRFLLAAVFPLLSPRARAQLRLTVVGRFDPAHPRCAEIQQLALPFPGVVFTGFATSLREVYAAQDTQIVASVEGAGIRTRVVESLGRGLPILATPQAVDGMPGLQAGHNYLALGDATDSARTLEQLIGDRAALATTAAAGLALYRSHYSRRAVRDRIITTFAPLLERPVSDS
jgi:glycosyltransferase involved in cell wall biosynthesis